VHQRLARTQEYNPLRFEHLLDTLDHAPLDFRSKVDQHVTQEDHIEEFTREIQRLLDQIQAPVIDAPPKFGPELIAVTVAHEMSLERRSGYPTNRAGSVDAPFRFDEGRLIDIGSKHTPLPRADHRMIGEHNGQCRGLFSASAPCTPHLQSPVSPPVGDLSENRVHKSLELGVGTKEIGFLDRDLAENVPPLLGIRMTTEVVDVTLHS
jgi:hypothetical protein